MNVKQVAKSIANDCIGYRVRMLSRVVSRMYDDAMRPHGVRFSQMNILTTVALKGPIQPVEVGRLLSLEKSTLSRNVRVMEENGWLRSESVTSGVGHQLRITKQGERLYQAAAPAWRKAQKQVEELLGDDGTCAIKRAVDQVRKNEQSH